ncbi:MAG: PKD domain-containing protein, partial [Candidatus Gracilibacteria bacterium]|nr:PKD domain-containing protein [Candidatus Gracilibacteria bacterium]
TGNLTPPVILSTTTITPAKLAVTIQADAVNESQPSTIQFTSTLSGGTGPFTYLWNFGDGATSTTQNPEHVFDAPGSYDVVLVVTDAKDLTVTSTLNLTFTDTGKTVTPGVVQTTATGATTLTLPTAISTDLSSQIRILDSSKTCSKTIPVTTFPDSKDTTYTFCGVTESVGGPYTYDWNFAQVQSGSTLTATGSDLTNFDLQSPGTWLVKLTITDTITGVTSVSIATVNITADSPAIISGFQGLSLGIQADKLIAIAPARFQFTSTLSGGVAPFIYQWNFADGFTSSDKNPAHLYDIPGGKAVQLTVRDAQGAIAIATVNLVLSESNDSDRDGVADDTDACPLAVGPVINQGCPVIDIYNGDTPATSVTQDYIPGFSLSLAGVNGQCRYNYAASVGAIFGASTCTSCPCQYTADFNAPIRSCDVIFPSIMSPNLDTIYSRGKVFEVKF